MSGPGAPITIDTDPIALGERAIETPWGAFEVAFFRDPVEQQTAMVIHRGELESDFPLLSRVHSSCATSECLMALDCDCVEQLGGALESIGDAGRGAVFYLMQEGRGAGLSAKARDRMMVQASRHRLTTFDAYAEMGLPPDLRCYDSVGSIARALGVRAPLDLLTNNPEKVEALRRALEPAQLEIRGTVPIQGPSSAFNRDYLRAKRSSGHALDHCAGLPGELPPEPVEIESRRAARNAPHLVSSACYFLPVSLDFAPRIIADTAVSESPAPAGSVDWFRIRVVCDLRTGRESVLLSRGDATRGPGESLTLDLIDRLPCVEAKGREALRLALLAVSAQGSGEVVVHFDDSVPHADLNTRAGVSSEGESALAREICSANWGDSLPEEREPDAER